MESTNSSDIRKRLLLSVQRALLGAITPKIAGVSVEMRSAAIHLWVYVQGALSIEDQETLSEVAGEIAADFNQETSVEIHSVSNLGILPTRGIWVFLRKGQVVTK